MKFNRLLDEASKCMEDLQNARDLLVRNGYSEDCLPTSLQMKAMSLLGNHDRESINFQQSHLTAFHSKFLFTGYQSIEDVPIPMLRFLESAFPWRDSCFNPIDLFKAAKDNPSTDAFPYGTLMSPKSVLLQPPMYSTEIELTVKGIDHLGIMLPFNSADSFLYKGFKPEDRDRGVTGRIPVRLSLGASSSSSSIVMVGVDNGAVYRREIPVRAMTYEEWLDVVLPPETLAI